MDSGQMYIIRTEYHETFIKNSISELEAKKDFADVTLACRDGQIESHKVILAGASMFFQKILKEVPHSKPLIILSGVKVSDLNSVLKLIYLGKVNVATADFKSFYDLVIELEVKGFRGDDLGYHRSGEPQTEPSGGEELGNDDVNQHEGNGQDYDQGIRPDQVAKERVKPEKGQHQKRVRKHARSGVKSGQATIQEEFNSAEETPKRKSAVVAKSSGKKRKTCDYGEGCLGCLEADCRKCFACLDMRKWGGPGIKKKKCIKRKCRLAPPTGKRCSAGQQGSSLSRAHK